MQREERDWPLDITRAGLLTLAVVMHGVVGVSVAASYGTPEFARRDWWAFRDAGRRVLEGDLAGLYDARPGGFPFLHPPYVASALAPLGGLGDAAYFACMVAGHLLGLGAAVFAMRRLRGLVGAQDVVLLGLLACAPWTIGLVLGQPSGLLLGAWLVAFWGIERKRAFSAGLLLGLCALKPPYVVAPIIYALLTRRYRVLGGITTSVALLLILSGLVGHWSEWIAAIARTLGDVSTAELTLWKQHTLLASLRGSTSRGVALVLWGLAAAVLSIRIYAVRRVRLPTLRLVGWLALGTLALSPFAYFYDALLLAIPAAALWFCPQSYSPRSRATLGAVAALTFVAQHIEFFVLQSGTPIVGLLAAVWFGLELIQGPCESAHHRVRELDGQPDRDG